MFLADLILGNVSKVSGLILGIGGWPACCFNPVHKSAILARTASALSAVEASFPAAST